LMVRTDDPDAIPVAMDDGENEHEAAVGSPLHARVVPPMRVPLKAETVTVDWPVLPAFTVKLAGETDTAKSEIPPPTRASVATAPLLVTTRFPFLTPPRRGVNVTAIEQLAPGARAAGQLFVCAKSPETLIVLICSVCEPALVSVITWAALVVDTSRLPKLRLSGLSDASAIPPWPAKFASEVKPPERTISVPAREPAAAGTKVTWIVQLAPVPSTEEHVLVS
jgi:hypothetical protein